AAQAAIREAAQALTSGGIDQLVERDRFVEQLLDHRAAQAKEDSSIAATEPHQAFAGDLEVLAGIAGQSLRVGGIDLDPVSAAVAHRGQPIERQREAAVRD